MGVDSNVFNENGEPRSDFTATLAPQARVWLPIARRALFRTDIATDLVWYQRYATERSIDPQAVSRLEIYTPRFTVFANGSLVYARQRPTFDLDLRSRRREVGYGAGVDT